MDPARLVFHAKFPKETELLAKAHAVRARPPRTRPLARVPVLAKARTAQARTPVGLHTGPGRACSFAH